MLDKVGSLLKAMTPPAAPTTQLDSLVKAALDRADKLEDKLFTLQAQQLTFFQSMLQQGQSKPADPSAPKRSVEAGTPATPSEMLRELVKLKEGLGNLTGDTEHGTESAARSNPNAPWWASLLQNLPQLVQGGAAIASMIAVASYNNAIAKTGAGQPTPVAMPTIPPPTEADTGAELLPPPPPSSGAETDLPQPGDTTLNAYHHFLAQLEKPLLLAMENNEPGDQFAEKLVGWQGQVAYDLLHGLGRDQVIQILSTYRPIWSVVSTIPQKFSQFLDEFLSYGDQEQPPNLPLSPPPPSHSPIGAVSSTGDITEAHAKIHNPRAGKKGQAHNPAGPVTR
jgi:hypothetical protein